MFIAQKTVGKAMKKTTLLFTMLLCTSALNTMENPQLGRYVIGMEDLSAEVKALIVSAISTYDNPNDIVNTIKATSHTNLELNAIVNDMYSNQKGFKALIQTLAKKFNSAPPVIAEKFNTAASKKYLNLAVTLLNAISYDAPIDQITQLINQGADVNYYNKDGISLLLLATSYKSDEDNDNPELVKLLLDSGANPYVVNKDGFSIMNFIYDQKKPKIEKLLIEAIKKTAITH